MVYPKTNISPPIRPSFVQTTFFTHRFKNRVPITNLHLHTVVSLLTSMVHIINTFLHRSIVPLIAFYVWSVFKTSQITRTHNPSLIRYILNNSARTTPHGANIETWIYQIRFSPGIASFLRLAVSQAKIRRYKVHRISRGDASSVQGVLAPSPVLLCKLERKDDAIPDRRSLVANTLSARLAEALYQIRGWYNYIWIVIGRDRIGSFPRFTNNNCQSHFSTTGRASPVYKGGRNKHYLLNAVCNPEGNSCFDNRRYPLHQGTTDTIWLQYVKRVSAIIRGLFMAVIF